MPIITANAVSGINQLLYTRNVADRALIRFELFNDAACDHVAFRLSLPTVASADKKTALSVVGLNWFQKPACRMLALQHDVNYINALLLRRNLGYVHLSSCFLVLLVSPSLCSLVKCQREKFSLELDTCKPYRLLDAHSFDF